MAKRRTAAAERVAPGKPRFLEQLDDAVNNRGKRVIVLTGDVTGLFRAKDGQGYLSLERRLYQGLSAVFLPISVQFSAGITFYGDADRKELFDLFPAPTLARDPGMTAAAEVQAEMRRYLGEATSNGGRDINSLIPATQFKPIAALGALPILGNVVATERQKGKKTRRLAVIVPHAGAFFPPGDWDRLQEGDRHRLLTFLDFIEDAQFPETDVLIVLIAETRGSINSRVFQVPTVEHIEVELPTEVDRRTFVEHLLEENRKRAPESEEVKPIRFSGLTREQFVVDTAGLPLHLLRDLLERSARTGRPVTGRMVIDELNTALKAQLGDVVTIVKPSHTFEDVIGYDATKSAFRDVLSDCDDPETAYSAFVVTGPNGTGKTFQLKAAAAESGRVVVELGHLRDSLFGGTDRLFSMLKLIIPNFNRVLIIIGEADTVLGQVSGDIHETEKRLRGGFLTMMGDKTLLGKVVWALDSARADLLAPDFLSRAPIQVAIFDQSAEERIAYVRELFKRKGIELDEEALQAIVKKTDYYSNRDLDFFVRRVLARRKRDKDVTPLQVLETWAASRAIVKKRRLQTLSAAQNCSFPDTIPSDVKELIEKGTLEREIRALRAELSE